MDIAATWNKLGAREKAIAIGAVVGLAWLIISSRKSSGTSAGTTAATDNFTQQSAIPGQDVPIGYGTTPILSGGPATQNPVILPTSGSSDYGYSDSNSGDLGINPAGPITNPIMVAPMPDPAPSAPVPVQPVYVPPPTPPVYYPPAPPVYTPAPIGQAPTTGTPILIGGWNAGAGLHNVLETPQKGFGPSSPTQQRGFGTIKPSGRTLEITKPDSQNDW